MCPTPTVHALGPVVPQGLWSEPMVDMRMGASSGVICCF